MSEDLVVRRLSAEETGECSAALSRVLIDCVEGGASVSFMAPMTREKADAFWMGVKDRIAAGAVEILVAELGGEVAGTVQLVTGLPENQPHRADVSKLLVHPSARRRGLGHVLMTAVEDLAREKGKTLLVLDTASDDADRLYRALDWTEVGAIPGFALFPDGRPCDTVIFYKQLQPKPA